MRKRQPSLDEFDDLRREFAAATDFSKFWDYFLDNWALNPGFMDMGGPAHTEEFMVLVKYIADRMFGRKTSPSNMRLIKVPEARMAHGVCMLEGGMAGIVYFEDLEMGLLAAPTPDGRTNYARFMFKVPMSEKSARAPVV